MSKEYVHGYENLKSKNNPIKILFHQFDLGIRQTVPFIG